MNSTEAKIEELLDRVIKLEARSEQLLNECEDLRRELKLTRHAFAEHEKRDLWRGTLGGN